MKCNVCLSEIKPSSICPVCGAEIEIVLNNQSDINWKNVYDAPNMIEAEIIKALLKSADIPVFLFSKQDTAYVMNVNDFSKVEIYVPSEFVDESVRLINSDYESN